MNAEKDAPRCPRDGQTAEWHLTASGTHPSGAPRTNGEFIGCPFGAEATAPTICCGALPPYSVTYIDPEVCATSEDQWFVMGTVDGSPRNPQGPVAICEYEPSAHVIAALLNASGGCVLPPAVTDGGVA